MEEFIYNEYILLPTYIDCFIGWEELKVEDSPNLCKKQKALRNLFFPQKTSLPSQLSLGIWQVPLASIVKPLQTVPV